MSRVGVVSKTFCLEAGKCFTWAKEGLAWGTRRLGQHYADNYKIDYSKAISKYFANILRAPPTDGFWRSMYFITPQKMHSFKYIY